MRLKNHVYQLCESTITSFIRCLKQRWCEWTALGSRSLKKTTKSDNNQVHLLVCVIHWSATCWKPAGGCMTTVPLNVFYLPPPPHNSNIFTTQPWIMPLPLWVISGLLLNFTVVSLPLPELSLQCFYFPPPPPACFSSAGTVLSRLNWWQGKTYWKKGHLFSFLCKMNEKSL